MYVCEGLKLSKVNKKANITQYLLGCTAEEASLIRSSKFQHEQKGNNGKGVAPN